MTPDPQPTPDELRDIELTAYALNELDPDRRADLETRLAGDPQLQKHLEAVRAQVQAVEAAFAAEPLPVAGPPPSLRSPWVRRGVAVAACLGLAAGTAWVIGLGVQQSFDDPQVRQLISEARQLQNEMKYPEAVALLDQALSIEPTNFTAALLKEVIQDAKVTADHRRSAASRALTDRLLAAAQKPAINGTLGIPIDELLAYPTNWPGLSEKRIGSLPDSQPNNPALRGTVNSSTISLDDQADSASIVWVEEERGDWRGGVVHRDGSTSFETDAEVLETDDAYGVNGTTELGVASRLFANDKLAAAGESTRDYFALPLDGSISLPQPTERLGRHPSPSRAEAYAPLIDNPFRTAADAPLSTFSIDVDTASYANVRRMLKDGQLPPADAVRIEEFVNSFDYAYAPPEADAPAPFATHVDVAAAPWAAQHRLVRIGLKGKEIATDDRPAANLVFLLDVSGSMNNAKKLPLVKDGLRKLVAALRMDDRIAIVVYAGASGLVVDSTSDHDAVLAAIDNLTPGGSTHASAGIELAYDVATANFIDGGLNRVILCTDGDFNVGITDRDRLTALIEEKAATGTYLSILGFGSGNLKDATMEELSNAGDGNYGYIDSPKEAEKLLARQVNGTLLTIAKDVKIQVEFNPAKVASYRLIGYANRMLAKEDFNNDTVDAGDIGSGHTVTALYEVVPVGVAGPVPTVDPLKYAPQPAAAQALAGEASDELLTVKLRYKAPDAPKEQGTSDLLTVPVVDENQGFNNADADFQFAAAAAGLGMVLRSSDHAGHLDLGQVAQLARKANARFQGTDPERAAREAFVELVERATAIAAGTAAGTDE